MMGATAEDAPARLKTVFCTSGGLYSALVLKRLRACDQLEICAVVRSSRVSNSSDGFLRGALTHIKRSGFAYSIYLFCITTLADLLCFVRITSVPMRTSKNGPKVYTTHDLNDEKGIRFLTDCAPDLLVSAFFNQRLREPALAIPSRACLNIHPSLLPAHKGVDPVLQAFVHEAPLGVTVHFMTPELDAGKILTQLPVPVPEDASVFDATAQMFRAGADLLAEALSDPKQNWVGTLQAEAGSYESWPTREEIRKSRKCGHPLLRVVDFARMLTSHWLRNDKK